MTRSNHRKKPSADHELLKRHGRRQRDWRFPKKPLVAPSRAIAADDVPDCAAPPKKYGTAWRPACRAPLQPSTTSFPEGLKENRSSQQDGRSLPQAVGLPKKA
jgi:hypothetical protein